MLVTNCTYDPNKDIQDVDQFGYIDLVKAFQNGYVPGESSPEQESFNDIEEPASIVGKPHDAFEAMRMQDSLVAGLKSVKTASATKSSDTDSK